MKRKSNPDANHLPIETIGYIGGHPSLNNANLPQMAPDQRSPETLPDPWLFDSEALIRELDRCRELALQIPARTQEVHFASNIVIDALWNLREQIRFLLALHCEGQRQWQRRAAKALSKRQTKRNDMRTEVRPVHAHRNA